MLRIEFINENQNNRDYNNYKNNVNQIIYKCVCMLNILYYILIIGYIFRACRGLVELSIDEEKKLCKDSHYRIYTIITLFLSIKSIYQMVSSNDDDNNDKDNNKYKSVILYKQKFKGTATVVFKTNIFSLLNNIIYLFMIIWGYYELFCIDCVNKLQDKILYDTVYTYWFRLLMLPLCTYVVLVIVIIVLIKK